VNRHLIEALRYGTCSQGISQFYLHTHTFNPQSVGVIPAFAFPAIAGTHLPTPEEWNAELAWVAGYVVRQFTCPCKGNRPSRDNLITKTKTRTKMIANRILKLKLELNNTKTEMK